MQLGAPGTIGDMSDTAVAIPVREVGLRDGLQSLARVLPTAKKFEWIRDAYAAGQRETRLPT